MDEGLGAPDVEVEFELAVEDAPSEDAARVLESALFFVREFERVEAAEEVAGMSPSPEADEETADEVHGPPLPEPLLRVCEEDSDDESPFPPLSRVKPTVASISNERKVDANFMAEKVMK